MVVGCNYPIELGSRSYSGYNGKLHMRGCVLEKVQALAQLHYGSHVLDLYDTDATDLDTLFLNGVQASAAVHLEKMRFAAKKQSTSNKALVDFTQYSRFSGSLNVTDSTFDGENVKSDTAWIWMGSDTLTVTNTLFSGPVDTTKCGVAITGGQATITSSEFSDHKGAPALCVLSGGKGNVVGTRFTGNEGNSTASTAPPGAAMYVSDGTLAVGGCTVKSNEVKSRGGPAIYCANSQLTVGQSDITYNHADVDSAGACWGCKVVAFSNTVGHNSRVSAPDSCNLDQ